MKSTEETPRQRRGSGEEVEARDRRAREARIALLRAAYPANPGLPHWLDFPEGTA